ncbi:conserved protein of unknown function [Limnospira indica PCC 8005]|uniref:Uncharacterized protein n=1 Tax=Limnospira indica PCC 8005 TaxID=376219 RepID=A0A9P1KHP2_9CYAN|nr:conserved protein of unknown function [Limnospira indica PCC 8005]
MITICRVGHTLLMPLWSIINYQTGLAPMAITTISANTNQQRITPS